MSEVDGSTNGHSQAVKEGDHFDSKFSFENRVPSGTVAVRTVEVTDLGRQVDKKLDQHQSYVYFLSLSVR